MFVKDCMNDSPITITSDTSVFQALELMTRRKVRHLPVIQGSNLVGLVTERGLLQVTPSPANIFSLNELNYDLAKVTVSEALVKKPISVRADLPIEEAANIMREKKIGSLLVMDDNGKLIGIVTQTDMVDALTWLFGLHKAGTRLVIETNDRISALVDIAQLVKERGLNPISVVYLKHNPNQFQLILRLSLSDSAPLVAEIENLGFKVVSVN